MSKPETWQQARYEALTAEAAKDWQRALDCWGDAICLLPFGWIGVECDYRRNAARCERNADRAAKRAAKHP